MLTLRDVGLLRGAAFALALTVTLAALASVSDRAAAQNEPQWPVKGKLIGKKEKKSEDISGIACTSQTGFPRVCLIIDDELQGAQLVTLNDGEIVAGRAVPLIDDTLEGKPLEFDGEGVAYAAGFFYVVGSHGHPRDKKNELHPVNDAANIRTMIAASSRIIRIAVDPEAGQQVPGAQVQKSMLLRTLIAADPTLREFQDKRLEKETNGVTVEGIAIQKDRLYVGFRGPSVKGAQAAVLSAALGAFFDGKAPDAMLHLLPLGSGRGVRDLAAFGDGLLILAGPTAEEDGAYSVYFWNGTSKDATLLKDLPKFTNNKGEQIKPEVILPLDHSAAGLRLLVMFDGADEGGPRAVMVRNPG